MSNEPDIIINIGGHHPARGIVAGIIASALIESKVKNVTHLDYDEDTFDEMKRAIHESSENNLSTANVLIVEWDDDDQVKFDPIQETDNSESSQPLE